MVGIFLYSLTFYRLNNWSATQEIKWQFNYRNKQSGLKFLTFCVISGIMFPFLYSHILLRNENKRVCVCVCVCDDWSVWSVSFLPSRKHTHFKSQMSNVTKPIRLLSLGLRSGFRSSVAYGVSHYPLMTSWWHYWQVSCCSNLEWI